MKLDRVRTEILIKRPESWRTLGEKSRVNVGRMCFRFRRDPAMGLTIDVARLTFGSRRRKRDLTRELLVQTGPGLSKAKEPQVEFVKRTGGGDATEIARAAKKHARSLGDASSVLAVANGISNARCDRRFSMELLLRIQPHYVPGTYFWG